MKDGLPVGRRGNAVPESDAKGYYDEKQREYLQFKEQVLPFPEMSEVRRLLQFPFKGGEEERRTEFDMYKLYVQSRGESLPASAPPFEEFASRRGEWERALAEFYAHQLPGISENPLPHRLKALSVSLGLSKGLGKRTMLDYGCGQGDFGLAYARMGFRVTLVDVEGRQASCTRWRFSARGLPIEFIAAKDFPSSTGRYEVVTCFDVLEHVPHPVLTLQTIFQHLEPGGLLFLYPDFHNFSAPQHLRENAVYENVFSQLMANIGYHYVGFVPYYLLRVPKDEAGWCPLRLNLGSLGVFIYQRLGHRNDVSA